MYEQVILMDVANETKVIHLDQRLLMLFVLLDLPLLPLSDKLSIKNTKFNFLY
jgi:hypothetical protein